MKFINRCVVTLKPKPALIEWVKSLNDVEIPEVWDFEGGSYLLDEHETEETLLADIQTKANAMLENELSVWTEDEVLWPVQRDYALLEQWFNIYIAIAGFDLGEETLLRADVADLV